MQKIRFIEKQKEKALFSGTLRKRVDEYFKSSKISRNYNRQMLVKTLVLLSAYIIPFFCILFMNLPFPISMALWTLMGFSVAGVGMSVMHDANHGSYSRNTKVNYFMSYTLNLLGGSVFNWKLQHNVLHHTYTNITDHDDDIENKLIFRFSPHKKVKWFHRFQFVYAFFFYGVLTLFWVLVKDFVQFIKYQQRGVNNNNKKQNAFILLRIIAAKICYLFVFLVIPIFILNHPASEYIPGFLLMHFIAGIILTVVFQLAHTVEHASHPMPDQSGTIENSWAIHQLNTTVNFSRHNRIISWYVGGLNFQVEHHLFPDICHVHYPAIAPIVKQTAEEFGIPYLENETLAKALGSHVTLLRRLGKTVPV
ncbi:MAG: acyl-CoA desaturase [Bacteroidia bacterium]|nr:acyl-CoA desaturase [Bacteroidia bacterium]